MAWTREVPRLGSGDARADRSPPLHVAMLPGNHQVTLGPQPVHTRVVWWARHAAICALVAALTFAQDPGQVVPDTKVDLTANPLGLLTRSLHMWDAHGYLGQVQDQAYGYLFPMGPFFLVGHWLGVAAWELQRLWWAVLLCVAYLGVVRLGRVLGIGTPWSRAAAGLFYAFAPRMLGDLGSISVELLPMVLLPWVVAPLAIGTRHGSPRKAAMRSGVTVLFMGGVNASATLSVLPLPLLYLLTRARGQRRRALMGWWLLAVVLAVVWWAMPLILLGRYSPPFLDWIENAHVTTVATSLVETLRGNSNWLSLLTGPYGPQRPAGWWFATSQLAVLDTALVAAIGLYGLARRDLPERRFLVLGALIGAVALTFGHVGALAPPFAGLENRLLDGALAAFRNVHKFQPLVTLPLVLSLAHVFGLVTSVVAGRSPSVAFPRPAAAGSLLLVALAGVGFVLPAVDGSLPPPGSYTGIPAYERQAAAWLNQRAGQGSVLVVPGSSFAVFNWGTTQDDPLQALSRDDWVVRSGVPLTPAGTIRMLDAVQQRLATGVGSAGLATYLARAGIAFLLVRNDLAYGQADSPRPVLVHQAIDDSPGLARVAAFGPLVGGAHDGGVTQDQSLDRPYPALEVYRVTVPVVAVEAVPLADSPRVVGGPESLLSLDDAAVFQGTPARIVGASDGGAVGPAVVTDGLRRRSRNFGQIDNSASATLTRTEPSRSKGVVPDYLPTGSSPRTMARYLFAQVSASSSAADVYTVGGTRPYEQPYAGVDGSGATQWVSAPATTAIGQWLQLTFPVATNVRGSTLQLGTDASGSVPTQLVVSGDSQRYVVNVDNPQGTVQLPDLAPTKTLRITLSAAIGGGGLRSFSIREIDVPGVQVQRTLVTSPVPPGSLAAAIVLSTADGGVIGCPRSQGRAWCASGLETPGEDQLGLDRTVEVGTDRETLPVRAVVLPRPGAALDRLIDMAYPGIRVTSSSASVSDPAGRAQAASDADPTTGWVAATDDARPTLDLTLPEKREISWLRLDVDPSLAASPPTAVHISAPGLTLDAPVPADGLVVLPRPVVIDSLSIALVAAQQRQSNNPYDNLTSPLPVGVSEVTLGGAEDLRRPVDLQRQVQLPCGSTPSVIVDGLAVPTEGMTTVGDLIALRPMALTPCGPRSTVEVGPASRVELRSTDLWTARQVVLGPAAEIPVPTIAARVTADSPASRTIEVAARPSATLLAFSQNANPGWRAMAEGRPLVAVTVDGWRQGYVLPAGPATSVTMTFGPDHAYRLGLLGGLLAAILLVVAAVVPARDRQTPALISSSRLAAPAAVLLACALMATLGWWPAAFTTFLAAAAARWWPSVARWLLPAVAGATATAAGLVLFSAPWGGSSPYVGNSALPQGLCLVSLAAVAGGLAFRSERNPSFQLHEGSLEDRPTGERDRDRPGPGEGEHSEEPPSELM